jgi:hypothetical protein
MVRYHYLTERKQNDSKWIHLQGWRFIHHPKVKKDGNNQGDYPKRIWLGACVARNANERNSLDNS